MILCFIILIIGIALAVPGVIVLYKNRDSWDLPMLAVLSTAFGLVAILATSLMLIVGPIESEKELNVFISQKEYIENYEPTSEYDTAAIATKKMELNAWLYDAKYTKENYPICSFYGDEILELEPIR